VEIRARLAEFLSSNSDAKLTDRNGRSIIEDPWGDDTLILRVSEDNDQLIDALNAIYLPPRFNAIWHTDTQDLEFIFTSLPVEQNLYDRAFSFEFDGASYNCEFTDSSSRLVAVAIASRPIGAATTTSHRNLSSYYMWHHHKEEHPDSDTAKSGRPLSFWIRGFDYDEDRLVDLARHVNFYILYCDPRSPRILIHELGPREKQVVNPPAALASEFPSRLRGRRIDAYLLGLWESSTNVTDPFRRFIYYSDTEYLNKAA
jgi:hypothetical protein